MNAERSPSATVMRESAVEGGGDHVLCSCLDLGEVIGALEGLGVDLVLVLRSRRAGREPGVLCGHLDASDGRVVARGVREDRGDRLARQLRDGDVRRAEPRQPGLLRAVGIVPEIGILGDGVQFVQAPDCIFPVKDASSAGLWPA